MPSHRIITGAAAVAAAAGLIATGAALSNAATTPTPSNTSSSPTTKGGPPDGSMNPNNDKAVTGTALASVTAAVKAKDSAVSVTSVRMDPDGSYDVFGTKAGAKVMLEVSKDLKTITTNTGGPSGHHGPGGPGGPGGPSQDTPVTGTALASVTAAVKANDSTVTVTSVRMDPDGSYDVFGTKAGANVMLQVSKDLKTITTNPGGGPRG